MNLDRDVLVGVAVGVVIGWSTAWVVAFVVWNRVKRFVR